MRENRFCWIYYTIGNIVIKEFTEEINNMVCCNIFAYIVHRAKFVPFTNICQILLSGWCCYWRFNYEFTSYHQHIRLAIKHNFSAIACYFPWPGSWRSSLLGWNFIFLISSLFTAGYQAWVGQSGVISMNFVFSFWIFVKKYAKRRKYSTA